MTYNSEMPRNKKAKLMTCRVLDMDGAKPDKPMWLAIAEIPEVGGPHISGRLGPGGKDTYRLRDLEHVLVRRVRGGVEIVYASKRSADAGTAAESCHARALEPVPATELRGTGWPSLEDPRRIHKGGVKIAAVSMSIEEQKHLKKATAGKPGGFSGEARRLLLAAYPMR